MEVKCVEYLLSKIAILAFEQGDKKTVMTF